MKTVTINQRIWATLASLLLLCAIGVAITLHFERAVVDRHDQAAERRLHLDPGLRAAPLQISDSLRALLVEPNETDRQRRSDAADELEATPAEVKDELAGDSALANNVRALDEFHAKLPLPAENKLIELVDQNAKTALAYYKESNLPARDLGMR